MEATGIYSMPVYHALIGHGNFAQVLVCNAGSNYHSSRLDTSKKVRNHIRQLEALGYTVALTEAA
jgi:hypothetical protein